MSSSSSKPPPHLRLHVNTSTTAITNGSAASPGSASSSQPSRSPRPTVGGGGGSGTGTGTGTGQNQACAACKYQRRKCNPDCPLAPYFPADQQRRFLNAHRLFGVRNIQRTLQRIEPHRSSDAMRSLIYQSEARAADPVGGCVTIIEELLRQIHITKAELDYVTQQIAICRQAAAGDPLSDPAAMIFPGATAVDGQDNVLSVDALCGGEQTIPGASGLVFRDQRQDHHAFKVEEQNHPPLHHLYDYFCYDGAAGDEATSDDGSMQQYGFAGVDDSVKAGSPVALGEQLEQHCQIEALPFVDAFNIKPQFLPATMQHHGAAGDDVHLQQKLATVLKHDMDEHMEEPGKEGAPCHLELGFSSI